MNNKEFIQKLKLADGKNTVYMWGTFGALVTDSLINGKAKQYPGWYSARKVAELKKLVGKNYFAFDCIGLIKGVLWGWNGSTGSPYGGAKYKTNGMPDTSANGYIKLCKSVSTDFSNIEPGEAVWMPGHIGVYIGNGDVIEATPSWQNGVQVVKLSARKWEKHGKMPQLTYVTEALKPISIKETTTGLNLREGPDTSHAVITVIPGGVDVQVYSIANGWARVSYKNFVGYCSDKYLRQELNNGRVTASALNVRSGPGTSYRIKGQFSKGFVAEILDEQNGWYKVRYGTTFGYVAKDYIELTNAKSTPVVQKIKGKVTASAGLNIRQTPGGKVIGTYKFNEEIEVLEKSGSWYKTNKGYCSANYIKLI